MDPVEDYLRYKDDSEHEEFLFNHFPTIGDEFNNPYSYCASGDANKTKKENVVLPQVENYANRGINLLMFSLYEYAGIFNVIEKIKIKTDEILVGRHNNATFEFTKDYPLNKTHVQRIRSKFCIPLAVQGAPKYPSPKPAQFCKNWKKKADKFAAYIIVLFRPWDKENGRHPGQLNWEALCKFISELKQPVANGLPSFLNRVRLNLIENMARGINVKTEERTAVKKFRCRKQLNGENLTEQPH